MKITSAARSLRSAGSLQHVEREQTMKFLVIAVITLPLCGCDPVRYTLEGQIFISQNGMTTPASNAAVNLNCPNKFFADKETKASNDGFYTLQGTGTLQGCLLFAEVAGSKASVAISKQDITDKTYPMSVGYKKDILIK